MKLNFNVKVFATFAHWASHPDTVHYIDSHFYVSKTSCVICFVSLLCAFFLVGWVARCVEKVKIREKINTMNIINVKLCMNKVPLVDLALFVSLSVVYHISSLQQCQTVLTELIKMKLCMIATVTLTVS